MVDHWPKSYNLSEDEEKMIRDYRREKEAMQNEQSPNMKAVEEMENLKQYLVTQIGPFDPNHSPSLVNMMIGLYENKFTDIVDLEVAVSSLIFHAHKASVDGGWWNDPATGEDLHGKRNVPEMLMLIVSEIAEAMEGYRKNKMDDKLPHHKMITVELADGLLRIGDLAGALDLPVGKATKEKRDYNLIREDHKVEQRLKSNGKKF